MLQSIALIGTGLIGGSFAPALRVLAAVSHLPHMSSYALVARIVDNDDAALKLGLAGAGFRGITCIAASNPEMWRDIALANRTALLEELDGCIALVATLREAIDAGDGDALEALFDRASRTAQCLEACRPAPSGACSAARAVSIGAAAGKVRRCDGALNPARIRSPSEAAAWLEPMSLSTSTARARKCLQSANQRRNVRAPRQPAKFFRPSKAPMKPHPANLTTCFPRYRRATHSYARGNGALRYAGDIRID